MIHDLKHQGLSVSAIAKHTGLNRKTVYRHLERGMMPATYRPRAPKPRLLDPYTDYLAKRLSDHPGLSARRLFREIRERGYIGGYSTVTDFLRAVRSPVEAAFERRFETPPGQQAQVDFAHFKFTFEDDPDTTRVTWLFLIVLSHSRWMWGRFGFDQNLQTVLRCHIEAFEALRGAPSHILYDRMKTAITGEHSDGTVNYNPSLVAMLDHYGVIPRACRPYRAKTKGKVERPFRYIRQDFALARTFHNLDDLNARFQLWLHTCANARTHGTTGCVVNEAFDTERTALLPLPKRPFDPPLSVTRRISRDGMVSVGGNFYSVPDATRARSIEVRTHPGRLVMLEDGIEIAEHPILAGKNRRRVEPGHRTPPPVGAPQHALLPPAQRPLDFYAAVGERLAHGEDTP